MLVDEDWQTGVDQPKMSFGDRGRIRIESFPLFNSIVENTLTFVQVKGVDGDHLRVEHLTDLVSHNVVDDLQFQAGCQSFLDAVDDSKFGGALFRLFEQTLGLIKETRVFEGDAHRVGQRLHQVHIVFLEGKLFIALYANDPFYFITQQNRNTQKRLVEILFVVWRRNIDHAQQQLLLPGIS